MRRRTLRIIFFEPLDETSAAPKLHVISTDELFGALQRRFIILSNEPLESQKVTVAPDDVCAILTHRRDYLGGCNSLDSQPFISARLRNP